jgi:calpain-15
MATREISYWKCERCKFINSNDDLSCYLCNIPRDEMSITGEWMCKKCSYMNSQTDDICILCETERELSILNSTITTGTSLLNQSLLSFDWQCAICSFKNKSKTNKCIMCSYEKEDLDEDLIVDLNDLNFRANSVVSRSVSRVSRVNAPQSLSLIDKRAKSMVNTYMDATSQAERIWKNIVNYCKANRIKFVDDSFPPCNKSLFIKSKPKMVIHLGGHAIKWLSPEYIKTNYDSENTKNKDKDKKDKENYDSSDNKIEKKWTVYNNPRYSDIQQGLLGDCWLLSGLAVLIEKPEMLHKIIITKEYCPQGCYQVRLCHYGEWQTVIVDDLFPCDSNDLLIFSKANRRQLWIPLIEKAMAKLNGSYESLIAGRTVEGLSALTGYPCDSINLENLQPKVQEDVDLDMIWAKLLSIKEAGYAIAAPCGRTNNRDDYAFLQLGLIPYHAYSVINVKKVNGHQLIQLRNP